MNLTGSSEKCAETPISATKILLPDRLQLPTIKVGFTENRMSFANAITKTLVIVLTSVGLILPGQLASGCACKSDGSCCSPPAAGKSTCCSKTTQGSSCCARRAACDSKETVAAQRTCCQNHSKHSATAVDASTLSFTHCQCRASQAPVLPYSENAPFSANSDLQLVAIFGPSATLPIASSNLELLPSFGTPPNHPPLRIHALFGVWLN